MGSRRHSRVAAGQQGTPEYYIVIHFGCVFIMLLLKRAFRSCRVSRRAAWGLKVHCGRRSVGRNLGARRWHWLCTRPCLRACDPRRRLDSKGLAWAL